MMSGDTDDIENAEDDVDTSEAGEDTNCNDEEFTPLDDIIINDYHKNFVYTSSFDREDEPPNVDAYPIAWDLQGDIANHGEVHAVVEEHDAELELRKGTTLFDYNSGLLCVDRMDLSDYKVPFSRIVSWYMPREMFHE